MMNLQCQSMDNMKDRAQCVPARSRLSCQQEGGGEEGGREEGTDRNSRWQRRRGLILLLPPVESSLECLTHLSRHPQASIAERQNDSKNYK